MNWINDGHALKLTIDTERIYADLVCPHDGKDLTNIPADDLPDCRTPYDQLGERDCDAAPLKHCNVQEWMDDTIETYLDTGGESADVTTVPVPVAYAWSGDLDAGPVLRPASLLANPRLRQLEELDRACRTHRAWSMPPDRPRATTVQRYTTRNRIGAATGPWAGVYSTLEGWGWFVKADERNENVAEGRAKTAVEAIRAADAALNGHLAVTEAAS